MSNEQIKPIIRYVRIIIIKIKNTLANYFEIMQ